MKDGDEPRRISSGTTYWNKRVLPVLFLGIMAVVLFMLFMTARVGRLPLPVLVLPVMLPAIGVIAFRRLLAGLADEVIDEGVALRVRVNGREERVAFDQIKNVGYSAFTNPKRITLRLVDGHPLGREVSFIPVQSFFQGLFADSPVAEYLIERSYAARRRA